MMEERGGGQSQEPALQGPLHSRTILHKSKSCEFEPDLPGHCEGLYVKVEHVLLNGLIISFLTFQYLGIQYAGLHLHS